MSSAIECGAAYCKHETHPSRVFCSRCDLLLTPELRRAIADAWRAKCRREESAEAQWSKVREQSITAVNMKIVGRRA